MTAPLQAATDVISPSGVDLSVILPVYNEQQSVGEVVEAVADVLREARVAFEIVAVDDGSTDGSADTLRRCVAAELRIKTHPYNIGNGAAIKSGIRESRGAS